MYLDNIIIFSKTEEQHNENLKAVFNILKINQYYAKPSKYDLFKRSLMFLGHIISTDRFQPDPEKIKVIVDLPRPTNIFIL